MLGARSHVAVIGPGGWLLWWPQNNSAEAVFGATDRWIGDQRQ